MSFWKTIGWCLPFLVAVPLALHADDSGSRPAHRPGSLETLPGTGLLQQQGDLAADMIAGVDRFLLRELDLSIARRASLWHRDFASSADYERSVEPNRRHFARIIGLRDPRVAFTELELVATPAEPALVGRGDGFEVFAVRWPALDGVHGEGLLLEPKRLPARASVVVIPDCEQTPEALIGLTAGLPPESQIARRLAENGCRVIVPLHGYCLSICSSDFSNWIDRTVSNRYENGYLPHYEYEIFEFDLGSRFNYADLAAMICPRPFMVEDMHHNDLTAQLNHAEYSRVRLLYEDLGLGDRTRYAYWPAWRAPTPYTHRQTFDFLHEQLHWRHRSPDE